MTPPATATGTLSKYLASKGYVLVEDVCPECNYGQVVSHKDTPHRVFCTAYGQCENAPG